MKKLGSLLVYYMYICSKSKVPSLSLTIRKDKETLFEYLQSKTKAGNLKYICI